MLYVYYHNKNNVTDILQKLSVKNQALNTLYRNSGNIFLTSE